MWGPRVDNWWAMKGRPRKLKSKNTSNKNLVLSSILIVLGRDRVQTATSYAYHARGRGAGGGSEGDLTDVHTDYITGPCPPRASSRVPGESVIGLQIWRSDVVHEGHLGILGFYGLVPGFDQYPLAGSIASWLHRRHPC